MKRIITILFIGVLCTIYGQQPNLDPNLIAHPVSPEAARLGTFGNVPINLSSGQLGTSIELFNGKVYDYSLPINLIYNYAGNRVEEAPSIVGLGWQLNVGGVITKEVRGLPDDHPYGYYNLAPGFREAIYNRTSTNGGVYTYGDVTEIANGNIDLEADKYHLSVNGINFSFKIGLDGQPAFLSKHNYKLEVIRDSAFINSFVMRIKGWEKG
jgi:hypothetical protein